MTRRAILLPLTLLTATALACSFTFELPSTGDSDEATGPLMSRDIQIDLPGGDSIDLQLAFAAGKLELAPGSDDYLVEGTAEWNVDQLEPTIEQSDERIVLASGELDNLTNLDFNFDFNFDGDVTNHWDLRLAPVPMDLTISAGAYDGDLDLGGLAIRNLEISSGASEVELEFSEPNQAEMQQFIYNTGASSLRLTELANANFAQMRFSGGAGEFHIDMGDELMRDAELTIDAALSEIVLVVPEDMNVELTVDGALANVEVPASFTRSGDTYRQQGSGPTLSVRIQIGAGEVELRHP